MPFAKWATEGESSSCQAVSRSKSFMPTSRSALAAFSASLSRSACWPRCSCNRSSRLDSSSYQRVLRTKPAFSTMQKLRPKQSVALCQARLRSKQNRRKNGRAARSECSGKERKPPAIRVNRHLHQTPTNGSRSYQPPAFCSQPYLGGGRFGDFQLVADRLRRRYRRGISLNFFVWKNRCIVRFRRRLRRSILWFHRLPIGKPASSRL